MNGLHKLYILIDDDPEILLKHKDYLHKLLHPAVETKSFADGKTAIEFFKKNLELIPRMVVISDMCMPLCGGEFVVEYLAKHKPTAVCIRSSLDLESVRKKLATHNVDEKIPVFSKFRNIADMDIFILSHSL
ncbi:hypothetical protein HOH51_03005 [bacterium]|jgi:DNA-binding NtrC family response regulator|nr:hypothetical protein [bacterium]